MIINNFIMPNFIVISLMTDMSQHPHTNDSISLSLMDEFRRWVKIKLEKNSR
jgi:hypothetical protein